MTDKHANLPNEVFYVYFNIDNLPAAWAAYRGQMISSSSFGTSSFRPLAYWPYSLLKKASMGDRKSIIRIEKEIALEAIRFEFYPHQVSRVHGIYVWENRDDAFRCETKWRDNEGQHFNENNLVEVGFTYLSKSRVDTQWIDDFVINNNEPLDRSDLSWIHQYWQSKPRNENPHWEIIVDGRGIIWGTTLRTSALEKVEKEWPHLIGQMELSRLAAAIGSDLYHIAPFVFQSQPEVIRIDFCLDNKDENDTFMNSLGERIKTLNRNHVNWKALTQLREEDQKRPDLRLAGFSFNLNSLSAKARLDFGRIISVRNGTTWFEPS